MGLREKEIDTLKAELRRIQKCNEELKKHIDGIEKENKVMKNTIDHVSGSGTTTKLTPNKTSMGVHKLSSSGLDVSGASYNQNFESHTTDMRRTNNNYNFPNAS